MMNNELLQRLEDIFRPVHNKVVSRQIQEDILNLLKDWFIEMYQPKDSNNPDNFAAGYNLGKKACKQELKSQLGKALSELEKDRTTPKPREGK